jgi:hypothetical protein
VREMLENRGPWLGQVPLILGPSSWGASMVPLIPIVDDLQGIPPYWGEWGVHEGGGVIGDCGKVGPFDTREEAFRAAAEEAHRHGAELLPMNGFAQVVDSQGRAVGPIT